MIRLTKTTFREEIKRDWSLWEEHLKDVLKLARGVDARQQ